MSFMCATSKVNACLKKWLFKNVTFQHLGDVSMNEMRGCGAEQDPWRHTFFFKVTQRNIKLSVFCFVFLSFSKAHWYQFSDTVGVGGVTRQTDIVNSWVSHTTTLSNTHVLVLVSCVGGLEGKNVVSQLLHESLLMWLSSTSSLSSCLVLEA